MMTTAAWAAERRGWVMLSVSKAEADGVGGGCRRHFIEGGSHRQSLFPLIHIVAGPPAHFLADEGIDVLGAGVLPGIRGEPFDRIGDHRAGIHQGVRQHTNAARRRSSASWGCWKGSIGRRHDGFGPAGHAAISA